MSSYACALPNVAVQNVIDREGELAAVEPAISCRKLPHPAFILVLCIAVKTLLRYRAAGFRELELDRKLGEMMLRMA